MLKSNLFKTIPLATLLAFSSLAAQQKKDTVKTYVVPALTVTSTRAMERQSPVPFSEVGKSEIEKQNSALDLPNILNTQPSVLIFSENGNGVGYTNLRLRGFDQRRIALYINGIPQNDPEDHNAYWINTSDIGESLEGIQVQRGAGMANYGSPAIAGSINMTTTNFVNDPGVKISSGVGFQEFSGTDEFAAKTSRFKFEYSSGLVDEKYSFYGKLTRINSFGYRDNSQAFLNSWFLSAARFDENVTTQINIYGGSQTDGLAYNGLPKSYIKDGSLRRQNIAYWGFQADGRTIDWTAPRSANEVEDFSSPHFEILNNITLAENLELRSSVFYYEGKGYFDFVDGFLDTTALALTFENGFAATANPENTLVRAWVHNRHGGWIPRLVWNHSDGILTVGTEIRMHRSEHWGNIANASGLPSGFDPSYKFYQYDGERDILSLFIREQYFLSESFMLNGDVQLVRQSYRINNEKKGNNFTRYATATGTRGNGGDLFDINYLFFNPRAGLNWNIDENQNAYFSAAYTQREPRMKNLYDASFAYYGSAPLFEQSQANGNTVYDFDKPLVKPEKMFNFEIGWKYRSESLRLGANIYVMEYFDELISDGQLDAFGSPIDGNAERTSHTGLELEAAYSLFRNENSAFALSANTTISRNEIRKYVFAFDNGVQMDMAGNPIAGFAGTLAGINADYTYENLQLNISGKYVGDFYTDNFGDKLTSDPVIKANLGSDYYADNKVDAYFVANANINYTLRDFLDFRSVRFMMQVNNITNNLYASFGAGKEFFPGAERNFFFNVEFGI